MPAKTPALLLPKCQEIAILKNIVNIACFVIKLVFGWLAKQSVKSPYANIPSMTKMLRARLVARGNLEQVGYRAFVKLVARAIGVRGAARGLDDGSVEIYVEATKEYIEKFAKLIDRQAEEEKAGKLESVFSINVKKLDIIYKYAEEPEKKPEAKPKPPIPDVHAPVKPEKEEKEPEPKTNPDYFEDGEPDEFGPFFVDYGENSQLLEMLDTQILFMTLINSKAESFAVRPEIVPLKKE